MNSKLQEIKKIANKRGMTESEINEHLIYVKNLTQAQAMERLKLITDMQQSEARIHWQRNNVFLVFAGILILAFTQFNLKTFQFVFSLLGIILNLAWLLIQIRSSSYIKDWKFQAQVLSSYHNLPSIFSTRIKGIEMRKVVYVFPIIFILLWILIIILICFFIQ